MIRTTDYSVQAMNFPLPNIFIPDLSRISTTTQIVTSALDAITRIEAAIAHITTPAISIWRSIDLIDTLDRQDAELGRLLMRLAWPLPGALPAGLLNHIVVAYQCGSLSESEVEEIFVDLYDSDRLGELLTMWKQSPYIKNRMNLLEEGIRNHLDRRYFSSTCIFLTQIEGVIGDWLGKKPNPQNHVDIIFPLATHSTEATRDVYLKTYRSTFTWSSGSELPGISRHAILHGQDTVYGTPENSLRMILLFDLVCNKISAREPRDQATEHRTINH